MYSNSPFLLHEYNFQDVRYVKNVHYWKILPKRFGNKGTLTKNHVTCKYHYTWEQLPQRIRKTKKNKYKTKENVDETVEIIISDKFKWSEIHNERCSICQAINNVNNNVNINHEYLKMHEKIRESKCYNFEKCMIPIQSTFNLPFIKSELINYFDKDIIKFFEFGWPINYKGTIPKRGFIKNHKGALDYPEHICKYLIKESKYDAVLGPFKKNPLQSDIVISPLNTVPKNNSNERRVILDLSFPENNSVNSGISKESYLGEYFKLSYPTIDDFVSIINKKGAGCLLFKVDLKRAYRQIPVDPGDVHLLGYKWKKHLFFDKCLPMGMRSSALICQRISNSIAFILKNKAVDAVNYLDDFGAAEVDEKADDSYKVLKNTIENYGLELSLDKCHEPSTSMVFLGVLANSLTMTLEVSANRLVEIRQMLEIWITKSEANKKEIQSLLGKLNFIAKCVKPARLFISRMLDFMKSMPHNGNVKLSDEFHKDIYWWYTFFPKYNGISMMLTEQWSKPDEIMSCDACLTGCGGWCEGKYFHTEFPENVKQQKLHINGLELLTLTICVKLWGHLWSGKRIVVYCDNLTSVTVLNTGRSYNKFLQKCLREICFLTANYECEIKAIHIAGINNRIPDLLSRWNSIENSMSEFLKIPDVKCVKELVEYEINEELFEFTHDW